MTNYQPQKYNDFSKSDIIEYLKKVKIHIVKGTYNIAINSNRKDNKNFVEKYNLNTKDIEKIFFSLDYKDFCYAVDNEKEEYSHETLYIFSIERELNYFGDYEDVNIYIKINLLDNNNYMIIVSFHERKKEISFLFKK